MNRQRGISMSGFLVFVVIGIMFLLLGFKIGPAYFEYASIQKQFKAIANDPALASAPRGQIEGAFVSRATIEDIRAVGPKDLEISKDGGGLTISASYSVQVPLFGNISACMDFRPSSAN